MKVSYLIVGQGLAGSLLGFELSRQGQTVLIIDNGATTAASRVAAGLVTPVTGQRMVKTRHVDRCLPDAVGYYRDLAEFFGRTFYYAKPMLRLFRSRAERERYKNRIRQEEYLPYLGHSFAPGESGLGINDTLGGFWQLQTGYVAINALLDKLKAYFESRGAYRRAHVDYREFNFDAAQLRWRDVEADRVIFCEGPAALNNPWFRWLPFQLSKGEILSCRSNYPFPVPIINDGHWLLPVTRFHARIGATYDWHWQTCEPSPEAKQALLESLHRITGNDSGGTVTKHLAGIRPGTVDKQPFVGLHPTHRSVGIFNGFGSKGALLIPHYCRRYAEFLLTNEALPVYVDIARFDTGLSMTTLAKRYLSEAIAPGDVVIDATLGNGHDTEFLAHSVGDRGRVFGFDIQADAIRSTAERLRQWGLAERVELINDSHENMMKHVPARHHGQIKAIVFNLGYLPGGSKAIATRECSTKRALEVALALLGVNGILSIVIYPGHVEGAAELISISRWIERRDPQKLASHWHRPSGATHKNKDAPLLCLLHKLAPA